MRVGDPVEDYAASEVAPERIYPLQERVCKDQAPVRVRSGPVQTPCPPTSGPPLAPPAGSRRRRKGGAVEDFGKPSEEAVRCEESARHVLQAYRERRRRRRADDSYFGSAAALLEQ